jgi:hypothetical protein
MVSMKRVQMDLSDMDTVEVESDGPDIAQTNYGTTEVARIGLCHLRGYAGAPRRPVPGDVMRECLREAGPGETVCVETGSGIPQCFDAVFVDAFISGSIGSRSISGPRRNRRTCGSPCEPGRPDPKPNGRH